MMSVGTAPPSTAADDVDDPDTVEVDEQMSERPLLVICLGNRAIPVDAVETHETLCCWNIDEPSLTKRDEHQLVHVIKKEHTLSVSTMRAMSGINAILTTEVVVIRAFEDKVDTRQWSGLVKFLLSKGGKGLTDACGRIETCCDGGHA
jgi:hypothetical protein